ncbi:MAG: hypothetical protein ACP5NP_14905 [Acetobacteraceae bacterium]
MIHPVASPPRPAGYAFPLAELETARRVAARRGWRLAILLDHGTPGEDYEEVLALTPPRGGCWLLWRGAEQLCARDPRGRERAFAGLDAALAAISA